jgi:hypothetical protein
MQNCNSYAKPQQVKQYVRVAAQGAVRATSKTVTGAGIDTYSREREKESRRLEKLMQRLQTMIREREQRTAQKAA